MSGFVRTPAEEKGRASDFQAEYEGSIPFTRSKQIADFTVGPP
jgi:hypothetical protein